MCWFHLDGFYIQCYSFSMDLEGRANFWSPFVVGRLQPTRISAIGRKWEYRLKTNVSSCLRHLPFAALCL